MRLHPARHVERVRTHHADSHQVSANRARRSSDRSASHCGCSICQSAGYSAMLRAKTSASAWVMTLDVAAGAIQRRVDLEPAPVALVPAMYRQQRRPGFDRQLRRTGRHPGWFAEEIHLDPGAGEVALGHQAHHLVVPQSFAEQLEGWLLAAGQWDHLEAQALPVVDEPPVQRLGFEPLGDGGELAASLGQPHPGHIPVAAVRQRQHRTAALGQRRVEVFLPHSRFGEFLAQRVVIHRRQPERLAPVAGIGRQRRPHQAARHFFRRNTDDTRQILAQLGRSPVAGRIQRSGVENVARGEFRHRAHRHPPGRITPVGHPAPQRKAADPRQFQARRDKIHGSLFPGSCPRPAGGIGSAAPGECRTVCNR